MNTEDYKAKLKAIEHEARERIIALSRDYAFSNSSVISGDVVTDNVGSVAVEKVKYTKGDAKHIPQCVYYGIELTKSMKPRKDGSKRNVYQSNLLKSNS